MSIRIWEDIVSQKKQVKDQREEILNAFKQRKVADELGMVRAEKLFQPITKLLGKSKEEEKEDPFPDYAMAGEDINYRHELPFAGEEDPYEDLKPFEEDEMMVPAIEKQIENYQDWLREHGYESDEDIFPPPDPDPDPEEFGEEMPSGEKAGGPVPTTGEDAPPRYSAATRGDEPPKYKEPRDDDSSNLSTLTRFIKNNEGKPGAKITTKKSKFLGMDVEQARYEVRRIYTERAKKVLEKGDRKTTIGQKGLGPYEGKSNREMRAMIGEFEKGKSQTKSQTGTGFENPLNRLSLGISSIIAGNTSVKLREEIRYIAKLLQQAGVISKEQKNKVLSL